MKINEIIKSTTKEYIPIKKVVVEAQKEGRELTSEECQKYFELNTSIELYKIIKGVFMEEVVKNKEMTQDLINSKKLTFHFEKAEKDGELIDVVVVDQSMDERIDLIPENIQMTILEKMVKSHKENIDNYKNNPELLKKEQYELSVLEQYLPKEATKEDIENWLNENYPNGLDMKQMGPTIGKAKAAFARADGKMISEVVKQFINK